MKRNLETADTIVKLTLASAIIILKIADGLTGPFAAPMASLAVIVIILTINRLFLHSRHR